MDEIRPFRPEDAPAVRRIVETVLKSYGLEMDSETDADLENVGRSYEHGRFYVVEEEGRILGCGGLHLPAVGHRRAEIRKMYLLPAARGRGLGKRLLERLLQDARGLGVTAAWLETNAVLGEALVLYKRHGFVERPAPERLSSRCDLYMEKELGSADDASAAYARACEHDRKGEEAEAIPEYERAISLGLSGDHRRGALLGLGSSLRNVGRGADAVRTLRGAVEEYPQDACMRCFLALALSSAGRADEGVAVLLELALRHAPVEEYRRALLLYLSELTTSRSS